MTDYSEYTDEQLDAEIVRLNDKISCIVAEMDLLYQALGMGLSSAELDAVVRGEG